MTLPTKFALPWIKTWKRSVRAVDRDTGETIQTTDKKSREAKRALALHAVAARPVGWSRSARYALAVRITLPNRSKREGDSDNFGKLPMDALQRILWEDDNQVDLLLVGKISGDVASTTIETRPVELTAFGPLLDRLRALIFNDCEHPFLCPVCKGRGELIDEFGTKVECCG